MNRNFPIIVFTAFLAIIAGIIFTFPVKASPANAEKAPAPLWLSLYSHDGFPSDFVVRVGGKEGLIIIIESALESANDSQAIFTWPDLGIDATVFEVTSDTLTQQIVPNTKGRIETARWLPVDHSTYKSKDCGFVGSIIKPTSEEMLREVSSEKELLNIELSPGEGEPEWIFMDVVECPSFHKEGAVGHVYKAYAIYEIIATKTGDLVIVEPARGSRSQGAAPKYSKGSAIYDVYERAKQGLDANSTSSDKEE